MTETDSASSPGCFPTRDGNDLALLQNGQEIFPAMLTAVRAAKNNICLETYVYWDGEIGAEFAEALASRARDGVEVRVVLDWLGCYSMKDTLVEKMRKAGVKVHHFRPLHWYSLRRINHRSHRKIMVVDGKLGFIGGVGIADEWSGNAQNEDHWRDNHYQVTGPVVGDLQRIFHSHWPEDDQNTDDHAEVFPDLPPTGSIRARAVAAEPSDGPERILNLFLELIDKSEQEIGIVTPYFMPCDKLLDAMHKATERGVRIRVLTCGQKTDRAVVRWASRHRWGELLKNDIGIYEFEPTLIHVKALLIDQKALLIGSANFDCRSCRINSEASLLIEDEKVTSSHWDMFSRDLESSRPLRLADWNARGPKEKLLDALAHVFRDQL